MSRRHMFFLVAVLLAFSGTAFAKKAAPKSIISMVYLPVQSTFISYEPKAFIGKRLMIKDRYGERVDTFSRRVQRLGYTPEKYILFKTSAAEGSDTLCYVKRDDKETVSVVNSLSKEAPITLYGRLFDADGSRHFAVEKLRLGWEVDPVITLKFDQRKRVVDPKIFRVWKQGEWEFPYPSKSNPLRMKIRYLKPEKPTRVELKGKTQEPVFYIPVQASLIPYQPEEYLGKFIEVHDWFGEMVDEFSKTARRLGFSRDTHVVFHTLAGGEGSDMRCYIKKTRKRAVEIANQLCKYAHITLYGRLVEVAHTLRHFEVFRIELGWEPKPAIEITLSQGDKKYQPVKIMKPGSYLFKFPDPNNPLIIRFEY